MIKWLSYSEETFKKAEKQDKPIFLHISAKWSKYCKDMNDECFEDIEIADFINYNFIPVFVYKDDRPDIDSIYQKASYIIGQGSGWPLNLITLPDGRPFSGINYKPEEGKALFKIMLDKALDLYKTNKEKISNRAQTIIDAIKPAEVYPAKIREEILQNPEEEIIKEIDFDHGGFNKTPKFPIFSHLDLLLWRYWIRPKPWVLNAIEKTINGMIQGGIYDHIEGGFHRYANDKAWLMPHFEKLAFDNAWHIINCIDAYCLIKNQQYAEIALETIDYMRKNLFSEDGFFYTSQFADSFYYTWTEEELLNVSEFTVSLVDSKAMIDERYVLIGRDRKLIQSLKEKLYKIRKQRPSPDIDKTLYCYVNGICAEAFIKAWRVFKNKHFLDEAVSAIYKTLSYLFIDGQLYRKVELPALLEDYAYIISTLISAYEVTAKKDFLDNALKLTDMAIESLWDKKHGGFFDSPEIILSIRNKQIHDTPYPAANSIMIINLLKLHGILNDEKYMNYASDALQAFSNVTSAYISPYYIKAVLYYFDLLTLNFYTNINSEIGKAALHQITPFTVLAHRENNHDYILPTLGTKKFEPIRNKEELVKFLRL